MGNHGGAINAILILGVIPPGTGTTLSLSERLSAAMTFSFSERRAPAPAAGHTILGHPGSPLTWG